MILSEIKPEKIVQITIQKNYDILCDTLDLFVKVACHLARGGTLEVIGKQIDQIIEIAQGDAEVMTRRLVREEGIFAGVSSGGALWAALQISAQVSNAVIVFITCDRGDRYLSTGVFPA